MFYYTDNLNNVVESFEPNSGFCVTSGIVENNRDTGVAPKWRNFPNALFIELQNEAGVMSAYTFERLIHECKGRTWNFYFVDSENVNEEVMENCLRLCKVNGIRPHLLCHTVTGFIQKVSAYYNVAVNDFTGNVDARGGKFTGYVTIDGNFRAISLRETPYYIGRSTIDEIWSLSEIAKYRT